MNFLEKSSIKNKFDKFIPMAGTLIEHFPHFDSQILHTKIIPVYDTENCIFYYLKTISV